MPEKNFAAGMRFEKPGEKAPKWVKGRISIKVSEFVDWAKANQNERGWLNIDLKKSSKGALYLELNTYQKTASLDDVDSPF